jgi:hypothetical protein
MTVEDFMSLFDDNTYFEVESVTDYASGDRVDISRHGPCLLKRVVKRVVVYENGSVWVTVL